MKKRAPYLDSLEVVHETLQPSRYLEIGTRFGDSLWLSQCPSLAIDPKNQLNGPLRKTDRLFEMTSDDFFAAHDPVDLMKGPIEMGFIDGMHLAEYALRDFIYLERHMDRNGIICFDDVLPAKDEFATREHQTMIWCGDVYKVIRILNTHRPDLKIDIFKVPYKGLAIVQNLNPDSRYLDDLYPRLETEILGGKWDSSVENLRQEFAPLPVTQIPEILTARQ